MREQIHHETVTPAEWLFCSDGLLPCFRDNETGIRNGPAFFQQARRAPLHGSPLQPACQTAGSPTGRPPRHPQQRSPTSQLPAASGAAPASQQPLTIGGAIPRSTRQAADSPTARRNPRFTATPRPVTKWRTNRHGSHPPEPPPLCALLHKPAGPPARAALPLRETRTTPPARAAEHARPLHPFCGGATRRAPPSPLWETRTTPPARAAAHARPLHPFRGGATRRAPLRRGRRGRAAENIFFLIPEYPLTTA